ncbi:MAG TPA: hypothetical protein VNC84_07470 [Gammaproteobacteria bacterium]|jgi:hypothetical protein|nr:hypothetical protein [Gammaproteobacteria bacterium]
MLRLFGGRGHYEAVPLDENAIDRNKKYNMAFFIKLLSENLDQIAAAKATNEQVKAMSSQGKAILTFLETCETHLASLKTYLNIRKKHLPEDYNFFLLPYEAINVCTALSSLNNFIKMIATNELPTRNTADYRLGASQRSLRDNHPCLASDHERQWRDERWWDRLAKSLLFAIVLLPCITVVCIMLALSLPTSPKYPFIMAACTLPPTTIGGLYAVRKKQRRLKYKHYIENDSRALACRLFGIIKDAEEELLKVYPKPAYSQNDIAIPQLSISQNDIAIPLLSIG